MLPHIFCCKKVCRFPPGILATLPKSSFSPPDSGLVTPIPSILLYIPVRVCYYNMVKRVQRLFSWQRHDFYSEQLHRNQEREGFSHGFVGGRAEHPAQGPRCTQRAGGHFAVSGLSHSGVSPHCALAIPAQAVLSGPVGQPAWPPPHRHRDPSRCHHRQMPVH